jgi:hypothetical protein
MKGLVAAGSYLLAAWRCARNLERFALAAFAFGFRASKASADGNYDRYQRKIPAHFLAPEMLPPSLSA